MANLDRAAAEAFLIQLEEKVDLLPNFKFTRENGGLKLLGIGGFALVYEMHSMDNPEKKYALKVIGLSDKKVSSERFVNTNNLQRSLCEKSENIVRILQFFEKDDLQFVLSEKLESVIIKDKFQNNSLFNDRLKGLDEIIKFTKNIGTAIKVAHDNGILHRDIKLENTFWDKETGQYKLGDLGIAKFVDGGNAETVVFTDGYGAPEIERHLVDSYNSTADIYSFGITLFLLLNDLRFPGSDGYYVNLAQYGEDYVIPAAANATEELTRIIRKMCSYRMEDRYQSIDEVLLDIDNIKVSDNSEAIDASTVDIDDLETVTYREELAGDETVEYSDETEKVNAIRAEIPVEKVTFDDGIAERNIRREKFYAQKKRYTIELIIGCIVLFVYSAVWLLGAAHGEIKMDFVGMIVLILSVLKGFLLHNQRRTIGVNIVLALCLLRLGLGGGSILAFTAALPMIISNSEIIVVAGWTIGLIYWLLKRFLDFYTMKTIIEIFKTQRWFWCAFIVMLIAMIVINVSRNKMFKLKNQDED